MPPKRILFLDYQILDHLQRIHSGTYRGHNKMALTFIQSDAVAGNLEAWLSEITPVEMRIGLENPKLTATTLAMAKEKDSQKHLIAKTMGLQWLTYPAGKSNDPYSRAVLSLRSMGPEWAVANALETHLKGLPGITPGDSQQVVSCVYGRSASNLKQRPAIRWFISEDKPLRDALVSEQHRNPTSPIRPYQILSSVEFVEGISCGRW